MAEEEKRTRMVDYYDACPAVEYPEIDAEFVKSADKKIEAAMRQIDWNLLEKHVKSDQDRQVVDGIRAHVRELFDFMKLSATGPDAGVVHVYYNYAIYSKTSHLPPSPVLSSNEPVQKAKKLLEPLTGRGYPKFLGFASLAFLAGCVGYIGYSAGGYLTRKIMSSEAFVEQMQISNTKKGTSQNTAQTDDALGPTKTSQKSLQIGGTMNPSKTSQDTSRTNYTVEPNKPSPNASQINVDAKPNGTSP